MKYKIRIKNPIIGVPLTFMNVYNPEQFVILGTQRWCKSEKIIRSYIGNKKCCEDDKSTIINGRETYDRIFLEKRCQL